MGRECGREQEQVASFMARHRPLFPVLLDADGSISARYRVFGSPITDLIDCTGHLVGQVYCPRPTVASHCGAR